MDWTDSYNRSELAYSAENMINQLITEMHFLKLTVHSENNLTLNEVGMLYRWPLYVGINTFLERLVRTLYDRDRGLETRYNEGNCDYVYFKNITDACINYYNNVSQNTHLLNKLSKVLSENFDLELNIINLKLYKVETNKIGIYKRQYTFQSGLRFLKRQLINVYSSLRRTYKKSSIAYEESKWMNLIFPIEARIIELPYKHLPVDSKVREKIKECSKKVFLNNTAFFSGKVDNYKKQELSKFFAEWIDHILPLSVIEGLQSRLKYYENILKYWDIIQVHSSIGYYYNDNYKCFAIMAKRKNAKLIGHEHGAHIPPKYIPERRDLKYFYKGFSNLYFNDYYFTWGDPRRNPCDGWDGVECISDIKIAKNGSVYLKNLKQWEKSVIKKDVITLLYTSSPLRTFMANLQEVTPEKNFAHRINVLRMLKKLLLNHSNLNILYKTFMGIDLSNDPIIEILSEYVNQGRVQLTSTPPIDLMPKVDIAFFDMISTGFAEAIQIGVPTLVYKKYPDYELASDEGKIINDELKNCGMVFFDTEAGIRSFEMILNDLPGFQEKGRDPIRRFQELCAYPVSKKEFIHNLENKIVSSNS